ncbi:MAG: hypothetical protein ACFFEU_12790 [Candidatus Thorarchaeota archaeon]
MNKLRKIGVALLLFALSLALVAIPQVKATKLLTGSMNLEFNMQWPGPGDKVPDWVGTITIDGKDYGMLFFAIGSGKSFVTDLANLRGRIHFFEEIWAIYDLGDQSFPEIPNGDDDAWAYWLPMYSPNELVLWGHDRGQTNLQTNDYHMNGNVEMAAVGSFSIYGGRSVHMSGEIIWYDSGPFAGYPHFAPGYFRIN